MSVVALSMALLSVSPPPPPVAVPPPPVIPVISQIWAGDGDILHVSMILALSPNNLGMAAPSTIDAVLHADGRDTPVTLRLEGAGFALKSGEWKIATYEVARPVGALGEAVLSLGGGHDGYAFALGTPAGGTSVAGAATPAPAAVSGASAAGQPVEAASIPPPRTNNPLLGNLSTYNPIYAVLGHGTNTDAKLELSFKYQLLGHPGDGKWYSGFHFAYTQRMFWDLGANSAPFRDVNYQPEFLYIYTLPKNEAGDQLSVRGGFLHESNGRDGSASRSYNIVYVQPTLNVPIGSWTASIGPRIFHYIINRDGNEDIARYRGHQALAFSIGQDQGLKLSTWSRLNFSSGKGSIDADLSYPLTGLWHDLPLYVVVQGFTGYGEDLLDYNRKQTRLRVGIGIVR